jgi:hypothetical protein
LNPFKQKKGLGTKSRSKEKHFMREERNLISGEIKNTVVLEVSQALPTRPCDRDIVNVKALEW